MVTDGREWASIPEKVEPRVFTVGEITRYIKGLIESERVLRSILVEGEISNCKHHSSGHMYFTLKDSESCLKCVMFRSRRSALTFCPEDGMKVVAAGGLGVYEPAGQYQLYVEQLFLAGRGVLSLEFELLKRRLSEEGLFDADRKKAIPVLPRRVGIITSPTGAAIRDMLSILRRRWRGVDIVIIPALVQGVEAPPSLVEAIQLANALGDIDVLIIGRGGGSIEDLWCFNDENVVRAIVSSRIPVVSAVGHETDFTLADFAADMRAPTPSAAAELVVPDAIQLRAQVSRLEAGMVSALRRSIRNARAQLDLLVRSGCLARPLDRLRPHYQSIDELSSRLLDAFSGGLMKQRLIVGNLAARLESLSPLAVLNRGYSVVRRLDTGELVKRGSQVAPGDRVGVDLSDASLVCEVESITTAGRSIMAACRPEIPADPSKEMN